MNKMKKYSEIKKLNEDEEYDERMFTEHVVDVQPNNISIVYEDDESYSKYYLKIVTPKGTFHTQVEKE